MYLYLVQYYHLLYNNILNNHFNDYIHFRIIKTLYKSYITLLKSNITIFLHLN